MGRIKQVPKLFGRIDTPWWLNLSIVPEPQNDNEPPSWVA